MTRNKFLSASAIGLTIGIFVFLPVFTLAVEYPIENPLDSDSFVGLINSITRWLLYIAIPVAMVMIIYAGLTILTAGGDPGKYKKGMETLKYAVIGLTIIFIGKGFISLIKSILELGA